MIWFVGFGWLGGSLSAASSSSSLFPSQLNLSAPGTAALDVLGVSASKAQTPTGLQNFVGGLVNGFDTNGLLKNGFAFTGLPAAFGFASKSTDANSFFKPDGAMRPNYERRFRMTNFSTAAVKGTGADTSGRLAMSIAVPIIDDTDWRYKGGPQIELARGIPTFTSTLEATDDVIDTQLKRWHNQLSGANTGLISQLSDPTLNKITGVTDLIAAAKKLDAETQAYAAKRDVKPSQLTVQSDKDAWTQMTKAVTTLVASELTVKETKFTDLAKQMAADYSKHYWNHQKLDIAVAYGLFTPNTTSQAMKGEGTYAWISYSNQLTQYGQFTILAKEAQKDRQWTAATSTWNLANSQSLGGRVKGGSDSGSLFVEYQYTRSTSLGKTTYQHLVQGGIEWKAGELGWLQASVGGGTGQFSKTLFGLSFNFNLSPTRQLKADGSIASGS